jgi:hypothetical protein
VVAALIMEGFAVAVALVCNVAMAHSALLVDAMVLTQKQITSLYLRPKFRQLRVGAMLMRQRLFPKTRSNKMKLLIAVLAVISLNALADQSVRGYTRSDGTYVQPHYRSSPNSYKFDNYGSQGNTNPYTGQRGYTPNEFSGGSQYAPPPIYRYNNPNRR